MDFDVQSSKAQSANWNQLWLLGCLATELGMGWRAGSTDFFCSPWWSDTIQREDAIAVIFLHQANFQWAANDRDFSGRISAWPESVDLQFPTSWFWPFLGRVGWGILPKWPEFDETPADELLWNLWPLDDNCCPFVLWFFQILNRNLQGCFTDKRITQTC